MMFASLISKYIAPFKVYIYLALAVAVVVYHFSYGHSQYMKGKEDCVRQQQEAQAKYEAEQRKKDNEQASKAIKETDKVSTHIQKLKSEKDNAIKNLPETPATVDCKPSADELRIFNEAVRKANGQ